MHRSRKAELAACLLCVFTGVVLAITPHLTTWFHFGSPEFLADNDDVYYLAVARAPYYGEWGMRDGFLPAKEKVVDLHSWTEFVPLAKVGRLLRIPVIYLSLMWRVVGASLLALALYWLFRRLFAGTVRPVAWALGCTLVCLCDAGFCDGRSLLEDFKLAPYMWHGSTPMVKPDALAHFRVVSPLLDLPFLIFMVAALVPVSKPRTRDAILGGIFLGLCVLLYFYLWTAAVMALGCYAAILLIRVRTSGGERGPLLARVRQIGIVLALGMAIGAPQIYFNAKISQDPQIKPLLARAGKPTHLPPGDAGRTKNLFNVWVWAKLAIGAAAIFMLSVPGLGLVWWLVLCAYLLANLAIVTGLEFENFHWVLVHAPMGEVLLLATLVAVLERWRWAEKKWFAPAAWASVAALFVFAVAWRPYEVMHAPMSVKMDRALQELRPLRGNLAALGMDRTLAGPWQSQVAMLYSRGALLFNEPYTPLLLIPMEEVNQRHALNAWLQGLDVLGYKASPTLGLTVDSFGTGRPEWNPEIVARDRMAIFERLIEQPAEAELLADKLGVTDMLLPVPAGVPSRGGPWMLAGKSEAWSLWTRVRPGTSRG